MLGRVLPTAILLGLGLAIPQVVSATQLSITASAPSVRVGEIFDITLSVQGEEGASNAIEGRLAYPADALAVRGIRDGNSIVTFWLEQPQERDSAIAFSGITPGGFPGGSGTVFTAAFVADEEGTVQFTVADVRVLRNDGAGSLDPVDAVVPLTVAVVRGVPDEVPAVAAVTDTERPEPFVPEVTRDASLFGGQWFVVFAAQDKGSGIAHSEVRESRFRYLASPWGWTRATTPHVLRDQTLRRWVWVRVVDRTGNARVALLAPRHLPAWYATPRTWVLTALGILVVVLTVRMVWGKRPKENAHE